MKSGATSPERLELPVEGMTCASCANRIERRLNRLDGVEATVNYATEKAAVRYDPAQVSPDDLLGAVQAAGYRATLPAAPAGEGAASAVLEEEDPARDLRLRLLAAAALSVPLLLISMIPALQFELWQWLALLLATPVVLWAGWPFHRAAWQSSATARRRWTPSSPSARSPHGPGPSSRSSSSAPGRRA